MTRSIPKPELSHEIAPFLRILVDVEQVLEIRSLRCPERKDGNYASTVSGYFNDVEAATRSVCNIEAKRPPGIYVTINPVDPGLLARAANRTIFRAQNTTTDQQVVKRRWLLIDIDPVRPSGVSSTDFEMAAALDLARRIRDELAADGWPDALLCMSGNGAYLLYRVELPNDPTATDLLKRVLHALAKRYDTDTAIVDKATYNASRLVKAIGTTARKGDDLRGVAGIEDRPHRRSWFERPLGQLWPVPRDLLESIAVEPQPQQHHAGNGKQATENVVDRCRRYLEKCPDAISGQEGSAATLRAAAECFRFGLSEQQAVEVLAWFNQAKTAGEPWSDRELAHKLADARSKVEQAGEIGCRLNDVRSQRRETSSETLPPGARVKALDRDNIGTVISDNGRIVEVHFVSPDGTEATVELDRSQVRFADGRSLTSVVLEPVQAAEMIERHRQLRPVIIDGLARQAETVNIVSASKIGKSWLAYSLMLRIATGTKWLDSFDCARGRVLLLDNELHVETLTLRLANVAEAMEIPATDWQASIDVISLRGMRGEPVDLYRLAETIEAIERDQYACIVADAWYRFLPDGVDENSNSQVMRLYNRIDQYAEHLGAVWVNIHHSSKGDQSGKAVTDVGAGAGSQSRAADSHLILRPHVEQDVIVMEAAVRSFPPVEPITLRWSYPLWHLTDADPSKLRSARATKQRADDDAGKEAILDKLAGETELTMSQLRTQTEMGRDRTSRLVESLKKEGRVIAREARIGGRDTFTYELPPP